MPNATICGAPGPSSTTTCSPSSTITGNARSSRGRSSRRWAPSGIRGGRHRGLRLPGDGHCPRGRNTRDGPAAGDRPGLRLCRENARGAARIREIPGRHRRIGNGSRPPAIRIRCGRRRQPAEDTTEAVPVAAKTANDFKGQHQRTDMRFSPIPTHLFEPESRTQA